MGSLLKSEFSMKRRLLAVGLAVQLAWFSAFAGESGFGDLEMWNFDPTLSAMSCRFEITLQGGMCSATAVSPRHLLTSAHCLEKIRLGKSWELDLVCPGVSSEVFRARAKILLNPTQPEITRRKFETQNQIIDAKASPSKHKAIRTAIAEVRNNYTWEKWSEKDLTLLEFEKDLFKKYAAISNPAAIAALSKSGFESCVVFGFGKGTAKDVQKDEISQEVRTRIGQKGIGAPVLYPEAKPLLLSFDGSMHQVVPGDSGGGLFCPAPGSGQWTLVGVTSFVRKIKDGQNPLRLYDVYAPNVNSLAQWAQSCQKSQNTLSNTEALQWLIAHPECSYAYQQSEVGLPAPTAPEAMSSK